MSIRRCTITVPGIGHVTHARSDSVICSLRHAAPGLPLAIASGSRRAGTCPCIGIRHVSRPYCRAVSSDHTDHFVVSFESSARDAALVARH